MLTTAVSQNRPMLAMPGGRTTVIEAVAALLAFGVLIVWITRSTTPVVFSAGVLLGVVAAAVQIAHLVIERFVHIDRPLEDFVTITFMLVTFLLWGVAGYRAASDTKAIRVGSLAGCWSAIVTMTIVVTAGLFMELFLAPPSPADVTSWAEYARSGWTDPHAFAIANTLESAVSHLALGPVIGAGFGFAGAAASGLRFSSR